MKSIVLTSTGLTEVLAARISVLCTELRDRRAVVIVNAAREGKQGKYVVLAEAQLGELGFQVRLVDVLRDDVSVLNDADLIYVAGGNTYKLMADLIASGAHEVLMRRLDDEQPLIYLGVSAGSVILGPDLSLSGDTNDTGKEITGLGVIPAIVIPHFAADQEKQAQALEQKGVQVLRLPNGEYSEINR